MPNTVEFYTLEEPSDVARLKLACRLVERAYLAGTRVLAWTGSPQELEGFDNLLWTFGDRAFVPHEMLPADPATSEAPVLLTAAAVLPPAALTGGFGLLLNLRSAAVPPGGEFGTIVEVIDGDDARRKAGRERFRVYREQGITPVHHKSDGELGSVNG
ncbi:MAG TPA: DNA polymerase III subunit chi [Steroidobacteraceae bacterium]|nr:DNA polymerase III subunit chi [Steroidobacteraceae bacterium]